MKETYTGTKKLKISCCEHHLKEDDTGLFIEELNIRLCGFGGIQPKNKITMDTIKAVKQFQQDYMKVPVTGFICKHVLESLDKFKDEYILPPISKLQCTCGSKGKSVLNHVSGTMDEGKFDYITE